MTEQELREKIVKIALNTSWTDMFGDHYSIGESAANAIADALIAAGIGDLKEHRIFAGKDGSIKQLYSGEEVEDIARQRDEYKHRAEVAERALCNALNDDSCYFCNKKSPCECEHRDWGSKECITVLLRQAEKELAEEEKE